MKVKHSVAAASLSTIVGLLIAQPSLANSGAWAPPLQASAGSWPSDCCGIHLIHMIGGKFIFWGRGFGGQTRFWVWDSFAGQHYETKAIPGIRLFCCGVGQLADGTPIIAGGTNGIYEGVGIKNTYTFNLLLNEWTRRGDLNEARWYPALPSLSDGSVAAVSGWSEPDEPGWIRNIDVFNTNTWAWSDFAPTFSGTSPFQPHFYSMMFAFRDPAAPTAKSLFFAGKNTANNSFPGYMQHSTLTFRLRFNGLGAAVWSPLGGDSTFEGDGAVMIIDGTFPVVAGKIYKMGGPAIGRRGEHGAKYQPERSRSRLGNSGTNDDRARTRQRSRPAKRPDRRNRRDGPERSARLAY